MNQKTQSKKKKRRNQKQNKKTSIYFWKQINLEEYKNFCPYQVTEKSVNKVFTFCHDFAQKLEFSYGSTLSGSIDHLIKRFTLFPATKHQKMNALNNLIKIACKEIEVVSSVLMEMHKIKEKERWNVIATVAERERFYKPVITLFQPLLFELSSLPPVWMGSINERAPRTVGAIPAEDNSVINPGQYVAAFVLPGSVLGDTVITVPEPHEVFKIIGSWILACVLAKGTEDKKNTKQGTKKLKEETLKVDTNTIYTIVDIDSNEQPHYRVERKVIIPLPLYRADPRTNPEAIFPVGTVVLALYTNMTCFFPAVVLDTPKTLNDTYTLSFRDTSNKLLFGPIIPVQQSYVIKYEEAFTYVFNEEEREAMNKDLFNLLEMGGTTCVP